jgi:hypothetical protein
MRISVHRASVQFCAPGVSAVQTTFTRTCNDDSGRTPRKSSAALPSTGGARMASCQDDRRRSRGSRKASAGAHGIGGAPRPVSKQRWLVHALAPKPLSASFKPNWPRPRGVRRSRRGLSAWRKKNTSRAALSKTQYCLTGTKWRALGSLSFLHGDYDLNSKRATRKACVSTRSSLCLT